jgi:hypothetical protein
MEQNVSFLTAFNNQIDNFLDDLRIVCPNEKEFGMLKNGISIVKKTNPRIILNQFNEIIIPYKEQLLLRNDSFFIVRDFQDDFTTVSSDYISKVTNKLKELWKSGLTDDDKLKVWDYFQSLISLAELASKKIN